MRNAIFDYSSKPFLQAIPNATACGSHWRCPKICSNSALGFSAPLEFFSSHPCFSHIATTPPVNVLSFCISKNHAACMTVLSFAREFCAELGVSSFRVILWLHHRLAHFQSRCRNRKQQGGPRPRSCHLSIGGDRTDGCKTNKKRAS